MNRNIIIAIIIVIIIAVVAVFALSPHTTTDGKTNTQITFVSPDTLQNGASIEFELKDAQGNALKQEKVTIAYESEGQTENYAVLTDENGHAFLALNDEPTGQHKVTVSFNGTDKYNGCTAEKTITIEDGTDTSESTQTNDNATASTTAYNSNSSSQSSGESSQATQTYYDAELNVYYDGNGRVIGGQSDGSSIWDLRNNPEQVDEEGNLV